MKQRIYQGINALEDFMQEMMVRASRVLVVCGKSCSKLEITEKILDFPLQFVLFDDFAPNPTYESVVKGVDRYCQQKCDGVLAIGGGSSIDVAKCIKLYSTMDTNVHYLQQIPKENGIPLFAIPTTAGTGSESTRFAVIYYQGEKQSVVHESLIPENILLDGRVLKGMPEYHRKAAMLDALCHGVESFWSKNSTLESRKYSAEAIKNVLRYKSGCLNDIPEGNNGMLLAANLAGRAINLTQTTAAHAMCYKLTSLYGLAHGHSAALCLPVLWKFMMTYGEEQCVHPEGWDFVKMSFKQIACAMGCNTIQEAIDKWKCILQELEIEKPLGTEEELQILIHSVNAVRLANNPVLLKEKDLETLYRQIVIIGKEKLECR